MKSAVHAAVDRMFVEQNGHQHMPSFKEMKSAVDRMFVLTSTQC